MNLLSKISKNRKILKPVIYGLSSTALSDEEKYFFSKNGPIGFIIFARNIENKIQLKKLTDSLKEIMEGEILILVDQEGGRVARLKEPHWKKYPAGQYFADLYQENPKQSKEELFKNFQEIAIDLNEVGINVNCAPVLDILSEKTHQVIGDRAYGNNPDQVSILGKVRLLKRLTSKKHRLSSTATLIKLVSRPKKASINPPSNGPIITPLCQPMVVHVAPLA